MCCTSNTSSLHQLDEMPVCRIKLWSPNLVCTLFYSSGLAGVLTWVSVGMFVHQYIESVAALSISVDFFKKYESNVI